MRSFASQSWLILRNDLRLLWRDLQAGRLKDYLSISLVAVLFCIINAAAIGVFFVFRRSPPLGYESLAWIFLSSLMLAAAINHAIAMLFERADFDLLLPSPVSPRAILLARVAALTTSAALSVALFLPALLNGAILAASGRHAFGYVVWPLLSCAIASASVWLTLLLVSWLGPRRARTWAQVIAALLGAGIFVLLQSGQFVSEGVAARIFRPALELLGQPPFSYLARAARGELPPLLALVGVTVLFVAMTIRLLSRMFISGVQDAGGIAPPRKARRARRHVFVSGLGRATFRKDLRLIIRDPLLLVQTLPTALYFVPVLLGVGRWTGLGVIAIVSVLIAGTFSLLLSYVAASGEECWDLVRMSPAHEMQLRHGKMAAGMAVPLGLALLMNLAIAVSGHPLAACFGAITSIVVAAGCARLAVTHIRPTPRSDILKNRSGSGGPIHLNILSAVLSMIGAAAVGLLITRMWIAGSVVFVIVALLVAACFTREEFRLERVRFLDI